MEPLLNNKINSIIELYSSGHIGEALDIAGYKAPIYSKVASV
jgi:hypothetical protein